MTTTDTALTDLVAVKEANICLRWAVSRAPLTVSQKAELLYLWSDGKLSREECGAVFGLYGERVGARMFMAQKTMFHKLKVQLRKVGITKTGDLFE